VARDEEAAQREGAAGHAREEDLRGVERDQGGEDVDDQVADGEGVGFPVGAGEAGGGSGPLAPEEVLRGREDHHA